MAGSAELHADGVAIMSEYIWIVYEEYEDEIQIVTQPYPIDRYLILLPAIADDELDPFEMRLLAHYQRNSRNGFYSKPTHTTAALCKMSEDAVRSARKNLVQKKYIKTAQEPGRLTRVALMDAMPRCIEAISALDTDNPSEKSDRLRLTYPGIGRGIPASEEREEKGSHTLLKEERESQSNTEVPEKYSGTSSAIGPEGPLADLTPDNSKPAIQEESPTKA